MSYMRRPEVISAVVGGIITILVAAITLWYQIDAQVQDETFRTDETARRYIREKVVPLREKLSQALRKRTHYRGETWTKQQFVALFNERWALYDENISPLYSSVNDVIDTKQVWAPRVLEVWKLHEKADIAIIEQDKKPALTQQTLKDIIAYTVAVDRFAEQLISDVRSIEHNINQKGVQSLKDALNK